MIKAVYHRLVGLPLLGSVCITANRIRKSVLRNRAGAREREDGLRYAEAVLGNALGEQRRTDIQSALQELSRQPMYGDLFGVGQAGSGDVAVLYGLIRSVRPSVIVETGVASGRSSAIILEALRMNNHGRLYSIDLPKYIEGHVKKIRSEDGSQEFKGYIPQGSLPGWRVPEALRNRWELILGDSREELPKLIARLGSVDLFYHDSDHSYSNMMFEYRCVWPYIRADGFLLSDDIERHNAFSEFSASVGDSKQSIRAGTLGIIIK